MSGNYPPGVTGNEYEIAGPDYERTGECDECEAPVEIEGYDGREWYTCSNCGHYETREADDCADIAFELAGDR